MCHIHSTAAGPGLPGRKLTFDTGSMSSITRGVRVWKPDTAPLAVCEGGDTLSRPDGRDFGCGSRVQQQAVCKPTPYTLYPSPRTMHPAPCTTQHTLYTLNPEPWTLDPAYRALDPMVRHLALNHLPSASELALSPGHVDANSAPAFSRAQNPEPCTLYPVPCLQSPGPRTLRSNTWR